MNTDNNPNFDSKYSEDNSSYYNIMKKIKNKEAEELSSWVYKNYFNEAKNENDIWYSSEVSKENVLKYISTSSNNFPHTLHAVVSQNRTNVQLRKSLALLKDDDFNIASATERPKNLKSVSKLKEVSSKVGNVSPTMINKITEKALQKFKRIYEMMQDDDEAKFSKFYENLVEEIAEKFATAFYEQESLEDALALLLANEEIKTKDLNNLFSYDFAVLDDIFLKSKTLLFAELKEQFVDDFWSTNRKNNLFQYSISRIMNPENKCGRKKEDENN